MTGDPNCHACVLRFDSVVNDWSDDNCTRRPGCVRLRHPGRENSTPESAPAGPNVPDGIADIVDRLLAGTVMGAARWPGDNSPPVDEYRTDALMAEAADDIACLRAEVERLEDEIRLRQQGFLPSEEAFPAIEREAADRAALTKRVAELEAGQAWRPIETAPKDGAQFIAINKYGDVTYPVKWDVDRQMWVQYGADGFYTMAWIRADRLDQWMPIPEPHPR
jgi:hypothetical protein